MVAFLLILVVLLTLLGTLIVAYAGFMGAAGIPSLLLGIGLTATAGVLALLARISQARSQHRTVMDSLKRG